MYEMSNTPAAVVKRNAFTFFRAELLYIFSVFSAAKLGAVVLPSRWPDYLSAHPSSLTVYM